MRRPAAEQPAIREDRAGLDGKSERPILPEKPGNAGGGKGPWFKSNARRSKGKEIGVSLITPEGVWQLQEALQAKALVCERMNPLERKPDAGDSHVRFDERGVETECRRDIQAPATARAGHGYGPTYTSPRHSSTLQTPAPRRVRARGLQETVEIAISCRPGALTGRVFQQALKSCLRRPAE